MTRTSQLTQSIVMVALVVASIPCMSEVNAQGTLSPGKKELVKQAVQLQQSTIEGLGSAMASLTANQVMQMAGQAMATLPEDRRRAMSAEMQVEVAKFEKEVSPILRASAVKLAPSILGASLEEAFNEGELRILIAWLESPVSRKYQQLSTDAQRKLTEVIVAETRSQIEPKLRSLEQTMLAKIKATSVPPPDAASRPAPTTVKK